MPHITGYIKKISPLFLFFLLPVPLHGGPKKEAPTVVYISPDNDLAPFAKNNANANNDIIIIMGTKVADTQHKKEINQKTDDEKIKDLIECRKWIEENYPSRSKTIRDTIPRKLN